MKWLTRMQVNSNTARREKVFDSYAWHKKLWDCFPDRANLKRNFLTRIDSLEGAFRLWVLSEEQPICPRWCFAEDFISKRISPSFLNHRYYVFDLKANPVKTIVQYDETGQPLRDAKGKRKRGKRIPLVGPDELREWLNRKSRVRRLDQGTGQSIPGGFRLVEDRPLEISPMVENFFRKNNHKAYHGGVQFRGTLEVTNREDFIRTYQEGIGSAKGFGFGLLLLAPVNL